jgi:hypothetical protein
MKKTFICLLGCSILFACCNAFLILRERTAFIRKTVMPSKQQKVSLKTQVSFPLYLFLESRNQAVL